MRTNKYSLVVVMVCHAISAHSFSGILRRVLSAPLHRKMASVKSFKQEYSSAQQTGLDHLPSTPAVFQATLSRSETMTSVLGMQSASPCARVWGVPFLFPALRIPRALPPMAVAPSNQEVSSGKGAVKSTRQLKKEQEQMARLWAEKWWPLAFSAQTSKLAPQSVWLLGVPLVLWWDHVAAAWRCTRDQCSHRLAPLSEGRIQTDTGCIECPYHGWTFDGAGACSKIPQLDESVVIDQRRARVLALPTLERQGLVWVWAGALSGCGAEEPRGEPATVAALDADGVAVTDYSRDLWMDATTLCENVLDPAHLPFTHHKTISNRRAARPVSFRLRGPISREGFSADRGSAAEKAEAAETADTAETAEAARSTGAAGAVSFVAPLLVLSETHRPDAFSDYNVVYAVPTRPGRCRILVRICFEEGRAHQRLAPSVRAGAITRPTDWLRSLLHAMFDVCSFRPPALEGVGDAPTAQVDYWPQLHAPAKVAAAPLQPRSPRGRQHLSARARPRLQLRALALDRASPPAQTAASRSTME